MRSIAGTPILITFAVLVCGEVQVLNKNKGDSAVLPCVHKSTGEKVVGLGLYRKWLQPGKVMYLANYNEPYFPNNEQHIDVKGTPESGRVDVSFTQLRGRDSDLYYCVFTLDGILYRNATGETEFFLHVSDKHLDGNCQCSSYTTLLYTTFAAVGLLLLIVLLVLLMVYRGKARQRVKAQPQIAIYEEMVGVRPPNSKMSPYHLEETDASLYSNGGVKMENPYE